VPEGDLLAGALNLAKYSEIQPGMEVLIHIEPGFDDPEVLGALQVAIERAGANSSVLRTRHWDKHVEQAPEVLVRAIQGVDILIGQGEYLNTKNHYLQQAMFENGLIYINNEAKTAAALSSAYGRFPSEVMFAIGQAIVDRLAGAKTVRVTTAAGTDVSMGIRPETIGGYCYPHHHDIPGHKKGFPGGVSCFHPEDPVDGVVAFQAIAPGHHAPKVLLDDPLRITYEDHRGVDFSGDCADWIQQYWKEFGDANSSWLAECMWGIHPRAGGKGGRGAANAHLMHFGLGNSIPYGGPTFSKTWVVMFVEDATLIADGTVILDNGHLTVLDLPEVRAVAERFDDADELLTQLDSSLQDAFGGRKP
jgi:hypothetical protein